MPLLTHPHLNPPLEREETHLISLREKRLFYSLPFKGRASKRFSHPEGVGVGMGLMNFHGIKKGAKGPLQ